MENWKYTEKKKKQENKRQVITQTQLFSLGTYFSLLVCV